IVQPPTGVDTTANGSLVGMGTDVTVGADLDRGAGTSRAGMCVAVDIGVTGVERINNTKVGGNVTFVAAVVRFYVLTVHALRRVPGIEAVRRDVVAIQINVLFGNQSPRKGVLFVTSNEDGAGDGGRRGDPGSRSEQGH